jgi:3-oxoacyl-[acyl-carrier-protein] synthase-3
MMALDAVSAYVPATRVPIEAMADRMGLSERQIRLFRRFHGLREIALAPGMPLDELLLAAARGLRELPDRRHQVRFVVYARAMPVVVPYPDNPLHAVCRALGLEHALTFTVTQQSCASGLLAIDLAGRLLAAETAAGPGDPDGSFALVLTGEKTFTPHAQFIPGTSVFGEAAAACLISSTGKHDRVLSYACAQRGEFDDNWRPENTSQFQQEYRPELARVIRQAVREAGLDLDDIRLVLPHNVNVITWERLCLLLGFPLDRVLLRNVATYGHLFCADVFANYQTACALGLLRPGDCYLAAAVGAGYGATFAAMVLQH